jgi:hypothetical protein
MNALNLLEDDGVMIGNEDFTLAILNHFIHASGSERSSVYIRNILSSNDVYHSNVLNISELRLPAISLLLGFITPSLI